MENERRMTFAEIHLAAANDCFVNLQAKVTAVQGVASQRLPTGARRRLKAEAARLERQARAVCPGRPLATSLAAGTDDTALAAVLCDPAAMFLQSVFA
jgi:hypothetical protein